MNIQENQGNFLSNNPDVAQEELLRTVHQLGEGVQQHVVAVDGLVDAAPVGVVQLRLVASASQLSNTTTMCTKPSLVYWFIQP